MRRSEIADQILKRLETEYTHIKQNYGRTKESIGYFFVDDLLPEKIAADIYKAFPDPAAMKLRKSLREYKYVAAQMDNYEQILEEAVYAFQDSRVVSYIGKLLEIELVKGQGGFFYRVNSKQ